MRRVCACDCCRQSTLEEWREFTQRNQDRAEEQRCESTRLRHLIDRIRQEGSVIRTFTHIHWLRAAELTA